MAKVSYPKTQSEKAKLYLHCMMEIKLRVDAINAVLASDTIDLFKHETSNLHLRHICELIAIGCLAAQGDYETQRAFTQEYSPPKIFNALREFYPHFFPTPFTINLKNGVHEIIGNSKPKAYSEQQVCNVWSKSGNALHRASVKKYLTTTFSRAPSLNECADHLEGIVRLMEQHLIPVLIEGDKVTMLQVTLDDGSGNPRASFIHMDEEGNAVVQDYLTKLT